MFNLFKRESKQDKEEAEAYASISRELVQNGLLNSSQLSTVKVDTANCGVSRLFIAKLLAVAQGYESVPTETIVKRVLAPMTKKRRWHSSNCCRFSMMPCHF